MLKNCEIQGCFKASFGVNLFSGIGVKIWAIKSTANLGKFLKLSSGIFSNPLSI